MKPDERRLLLALAFQVDSPIVMVRGLIRALKVDRERAVYLCNKWSDKGWYEYGVSPLLGWLTDAGVKAAEQSKGVVRANRTVR